MTGKELAALRRRANISQSMLASQVGVSRQTISYWENRPVLDGRAVSIARIAEVFDITDRPRLLNSRPGMGFVHLRLTGLISQAHLRTLFTAKVTRKAIQTQMLRRSCCAMTRRGVACRLKSEPGKARCRLHGGLSTGPKTVEGRARIAAAQRKRWAQRRGRGKLPEKT